MVKLTELLVTQSDLRHAHVLPEMVNYVQRGGFWTPLYLAEYASDRCLRVSPKIQITCFPDGDLYLHDGHHRCTSTWLGGRNYLRSDEYDLQKWTYDEYLEINGPNKWFTPFDPRTHVRVPDIAAFRKEAAQRFQADPMATVKWIRDNTHLFRVDRTVHTVAEFAEKLRHRLAKAA